MVRHLGETLSKFRTLIRQSTGLHRFKMKGGGKDVLKIVPCKDDTDFLEDGHKIMEHDWELWNLNKPSFVFAINSDLRVPMCKRIAKWLGARHCRLPFHVHRNNTNRGLMSSSDWGHSVQYVGWHQHHVRPF